VQLGMIGLGRMGAGMVKRLAKAGHECVVADLDAKVVQGLVDAGGGKIVGSTSLEDFIKKLTKPRAVWLMIPVGAVDSMIAKLTPMMEAGDTLIDGGNSYYVDDIARAKKLKEKGFHYVDVGTSGGIWGEQRGYCQMIGGETEVVQRLDPIFRALAPGVDAHPVRTPGRESDTKSPAVNGYLHCGSNGGGHFVKMVHNGIEYGIMAAYAEGLNILKHANVGKQKQGEHSAEVTPLRNPEHYMYDFNLPEITELWRRGSVIGSWLLDLTASALRKDPDLKGFKGSVSDSGEGRWTIDAAIDEAVPAYVLTTSLYERFASRGEALFGDKATSAMRKEFGGHDELTAKPAGL
jgi:6-phosphogluconate dehydrogenase